MDPYEKNASTIVFLVFSNNSKVSICSEKSEKL
jgi:hypothetical protein